MSTSTMMTRFARLLTGALLGACALPHDAWAGAPCGDWQVSPTSLPGGAERAIVRDVVAVGPGEVWAVGDWQATVDGVYQTFAFTMRFDGASWSHVPTPQPAACTVCHNVALWSVDATGPDDVWAAGHKNVQAPDGFTGTHILVMHWDGDAWAVMDTPVASGGSGDVLWDVEAIAPDDVWFFGERAPGSLTLDLAIALHWDGSGFEFVDVPVVNTQSSGFGDGNSLHAGSALSSDDIWAVGAGGDGDPLPCGLSQIHHWNGSDWEHLPAPDPEGCLWHSLDAVVAIAPDDVWVGGEYYDGSYHGLAMHWDGSDWTRAPAPGGITGFVAFGGDNVYASGAGVMRWDGASWSVVESFPGVVGAALAGITASGPCEVWAGGRRLDGEALLPLMVRGSAGGSSSSDLNGDGAVGGADLAILLGLWGSAGSADLNNDGVVDGADLAMLLGNWN